MQDLEVRGIGCGGRGREGSTFPRIVGEAGELVVPFVAAGEVEEGDEILILFGSGHGG